MVTLSKIVQLFYVRAQPHKRCKGQDGLRTWKQKQAERIRAWPRDFTFPTQFGSRQRPTPIPTPHPLTSVTNAVHFAKGLFLMTYFLCWSLYLLMFCWRYVLYAEHWTGLIYIWLHVYVHTVGERGEEGEGGLSPLPRSICSSSEVIQASTQHHCERDIRGRLNSSSSTGMNNHHHHRGHCHLNCREWP